MPKTETRREGVAPSREGVESVLLSVRDAATMLGISSTHLRQLIYRGEMPVVRLGRRVLIARADLEDIAASSVSEDWTTDE